MIDPPPDKLAVELFPPSPEWAILAATEAARLKSALGDVLITVHHIDSTAIPGILAKPIVDLIPVVTDLPALDAREDAIRALGYKWYGEFGLLGRRYCTLTDAVAGKRKVQLHCYAEGAEGLPRHLAFRDYLRAHPDIAKAYEAEKLRAAALHPTTRSPTTAPRTTGSRKRNATRSNGSRQGREREFSRGGGGRGQGEYRKLSVRRKAILARKARHGINERQNGPR